MPAYGMTATICQATTRLDFLTSGLNGVYTSMFSRLSALCSPPLPRVPTVAVHLVYIWWLYVAQPLYYILLTSLLGFLLVNRGPNVLIWSDARTVPESHS